MPPGGGELDREPPTEPSPNDPLPPKDPLPPACGDGGDEDEGEDDDDGEDDDVDDDDDDDDDVDDNVDDDWCVLMGSGVYVDECISPAPSQRTTRRTARRTPSYWRVLPLRTSDQGYWARRVQPR